MDGRDALNALAKVAGRGLAIKAGAAGAVAFILFLLLIGMFGAGIGGKAHADSCGGRGTPGVDLDDGAGDKDGEGKGQKPGNAHYRKDQIANAKIIDRVAADGGLSGRATLIALMTALQESTLLNLDHGPGDSVGLFQQKPSYGWGTHDQIMKPKFAAKMFYFGADSGSPRGLTDIKGWESKPLHVAAEGVQHSTQGELYAGQEDAARAIAEQAKIDLGRKGKADAGNEDQDQDDAANGDDQADDDGPEECYRDGDEGGKKHGGKPGQPFHDGDAPWPDNVKNPRSTQDAIKWAKAEAENGGNEWYQACLAFVARVYGWGYSGVPYAIDHYKEMPLAMKHDHGRNPPPGALMYWDTGKRAGHVAVYLGDGKIASNDIERPGYIDVVDATKIESKWGATYLGWAPPYFPKGG